MPRRPKGPRADRPTHIPGTTDGTKRSRGRRYDKPAEPPQPLADICPACFGKGTAPRCQFWDMRPIDREDATSPLIFFQCSKPARTGRSVCGWHGAGFAVREQRKQRQAAMQGRPDKEAAEAKFLAANPDARERYLSLLNSPTLFDLSPTVAMARTAVEHYATRADLNITQTRDGSDPPILRLVKAAETLANVASKVLDIERKLGPVTNAEVERFINACGVTLARFIPTDELADAEAFFLGLLVRDDVHPMGRLRRAVGEGDPSGPLGGDGSGRDDPGAP